MIETLVLLIGRNKLFREGLKSLLNGSQFSVIGEGDDVAHIANLTNGDRPDIVIVDMSDKPEHANDDIGLLRERLPESRIVVKGHTDSVGDESLNLRLSEDRARNVKNLLIAQGVAEYRITSIGLGEQLPVATNSTEVGRSQNRRVEIEIKANEGLQGGY